jgi:hypothetical protein
MYAANPYQPMNPMMAQGMVQPQMNPMMNRYPPQPPQMNQPQPTMPYQPAVLQQQATAVIHQAQVQAQIAAAAAAAAAASTRNRWMPPPSAMQQPSINPQSAPYSAPPQPAFNPNMPPSNYYPQQQPINSTASLDAAREARLRAIESSNNNTASNNTASGRYGAEFNAGDEVRVTYMDGKTYQGKIVAQASATQYTVKLTDPNAPISHPVPVFRNRIHKIR